MRVGRRWAAFMMAGFMLCFSPLMTLAEEKPQEDLRLYAQSAVLIDAGNGRVLYGKGQDIIRPMASTTKIMTCILALELGNLETQVTASGKAASQPKVHLGVRKGEQYRLKDLLYALMLESYNDAAVMIAEEIGGSTQGFADLMNEKAEALGCKNTYFITANGLDGAETDKQGNERIHSTTAAELAQIMRYCISQSPKQKEFLEITGTQNHSFTDAAGKRSFQCSNHNAFLQMMEGALSGKTGFTGGAGYSYVGALKKDEKCYIIALLGCGWPPHKSYKWADARTLYSYGIERYERRDVFRTEVLPPIPVTGGLSWKESRKETAVHFKLKEEERHLYLLLKEGEQVEVKKHLPSTMKAPVLEGQLVGEIEYRIDGITLKRVGVYASDTVEELTFRRAWGLVSGIFVIS